MIPTRMTDTRDMTPEQADVALQMIFLARLYILRMEAEAEKDIDLTRQSLALATAETRTTLAVKEAQLNAYILRHPDEFARPRMRKTPWGTYGLRSSTRTVIENEAALIEWAKENGHMDLVQTVEKIAQKAVAKRIKSGQEIPGARSETGETAEYKLDTAALEAEL